MKINVNDLKPGMVIDYKGQHFKIVSEPGGAVAAAAAIFSADKLSEKDIIVVVSGGNVDSEIFSKAISENR